MEGGDHSLKVRGGTQACMEAIDAAGRAAAAFAVSACEGVLDMQHVAWLATIYIVGFMLPTYASSTGYEQSAETGGNASHNLDHLFQ